MKSFSMSNAYPLVRFLVPFSLLFCLAGCSDRKAASAGPGPSAAGTGKKSVPVFVSATSGFSTHSSATAVNGKKKPDDAQVKDAGAPTAEEAKSVYLAGEDPVFARKNGWPVKSPAQLPGAIMPKKRIVAYYGNPLSKRMGALGEYEQKEMLHRLKAEAKRWSEADPSVPVLPALHLIAVVAQGEAGKAGKYRMLMPDEIVNQVYGWAREANCLLFIDIQTGHEDIRTLLPRFEWILKNPDVHLGIDPEFNLVASKKVPGTRIGTFDAADINFVTGYLKDLVTKYHLPPKVLTVHRFTRNGLTNYRRVVLRPEVQIVMNMDGWGGPHLKRASYQDYIVTEPVQFAGFKLFYHNDTKKGDPLMMPKDVLRLKPRPFYIMYQ